MTPNFEASLLLKPASPLTAASVAPDPNVNAILTYAVVHWPIHCMFYMIQFICIHIGNNLAEFDMTIFISIVKCNKEGGSKFTLNCFFLVSYLEASFLGFCFVHSKCICWMSLFLLCDPVWLKFVFYNSRRFFSSIDSKVRLGWKDSNQITRSLPRVINIFTTDSSMQFTMSCDHLDQKNWFRFFLGIIDKNDFISIRIGMAWR